MKIKYIALSALTLLTSACGGVFGAIQTYDGDRLPDSAVAKLVVRRYTTGYAPRDSYGKINTISIDNRRVSSFFLSNDNTDQELQILPGNRKIGIEYEWGDNNCRIVYSGPDARTQTCSPVPLGTSSCSITINLHPNLNYNIEVTRNYDKGPYSVDIEDKQIEADEVVSKGICSLK